MLTWGWIVLRRTDTVHSAKWYGKVCTAVLYTSMAALVLLPDLSKTGRDIIVVLCGSVMLMSLVLYSRWFLRLLREDPGKGLGHSLKETSVVRTSAPLAGAAMVLAVLVICAGVVALYRKTVAACLLLALAAVVFGVCLWLRKNRRPSEEEKEKEPSADEHTE